MTLIHSSGAEATTKGRPFLVVALVPLAALVEESGEQSTLARQLEHQGMIGGETVQRIACDATIVVALDEDIGHTILDGTFLQPHARRRSHRTAESVLTPLSE